MTLANAFNCSTLPVQSNYAVNPDYRLGMCRCGTSIFSGRFRMGIVLNIGYNGAKGGEPGYVAGAEPDGGGVLNPDAQAFNYEDSLGYSRFNGLA